MDIKNHYRVRRTSMSYDRLMQVVAEQAMQRAMVQISRAKRVRAVQVLASHRGVATVPRVMVL